jgi:hypothetical protein
VTPCLCHAQNLAGRGRSSKSRRLFSTRLEERAPSIKPGEQSILDFRLRGKTLLIDPCIPRKWPGFEIVYRYGATRYEIAVETHAA